MSSLDMFADVDRLTLTIGELPPDAREALLAVSPASTEATTLDTIPEGIRAQAAALVYTARKGHLPGGRTYPIGTQIYPDSWRSESHRPWLPSKKEHQDCCDDIRRPSWRYHWGLFDHCRTLPHVAALLSVSVTEVRAVIRQGLPEVGDRWIRLAKG